MRKTIQTINRYERGILEQALSSIFGLSEGDYYDDNFLMKLMQLLAISDVNIIKVMSVYEKITQQQSNGVFQYFTNSTVPLPTYKYELESSHVCNHRAL